MSFLNLIIKRGISTTSANYGKRNFKKFSLHNKRGTKIFKEQRRDPNYDIPIDKRGVRDVGYTDINGKFVLIPERIPELIVPDLKDFTLKPYVSYRTPDVVQEAFTAEHLFNVIYAPKIAKDYKDGKLNEDLTPTEPSQEEKLTSEEARDNAAKTGSDLF